MAKRLLFIFLIFIIADIYFYQAIITVTSNTSIHFVYWLVDMLIIGAMIAFMSIRKTGKSVQHFIPVIMTALLLVCIPKIFSSPILLLEDVFRLFTDFPPRSLYFSEATLVLASFIVLSMIFGLTRGKYFYKVKRKDLFFEDLPASFNGFTITQLSDIHSGSLKNSKRVMQGISLANAQQSDLILFTGDLVNHKASEMLPWISSFAQLTAPYGKYSILGNHDYGDYVGWESQDAKTDNLTQLKNVQAEIGFKLLLNESVWLTKDDEKIALIGVENWGKGGFQQYGDLSKAMMHVSDNSFKILMSHDPSHWEAETIHHKQHIHLTLAGHTHGMQFGIELFGLKWSPIKYFYKQWAGLYKKGKKYLYVNRGFGFHGLAGRIGIWPEITVFTLRNLTQK